MKKIFTITILSLFLAQIALAVNQQILTVTIPSGNGTYNFSNSWHWLGINANCNDGISGGTVYVGSIACTDGCTDGNNCSNTTTLLSGNVGVSTDSGEGATIYLSGFYDGGGGGILSIGNIDDIFASVGTLTTDLWVLIAVAIGVPLAFYIIRQVIAIIPKGKAKNL
jgi:hypothetical protein